MNTETLFGDGVALVFGMEWLPLLGGRPDRQARSLARSRRAGQFVVAARGAASVGLLRGVSTRHRGRATCSAAAAFASLHPEGAVAAVLSLPSGRRWLVATHEGAVVTRGDLVCDAAFPLQDTIRLLHDAYPGLAVHDNPATHSGLLDALLRTAPEVAELQTLSRLGLRSLGAAVFAALVCGAWAPAAIERLRGSSPADASAQPDPVVAWRSAVQASARQHVLHGVAGLQAALDAIRAVPVTLAGWTLTEIECRPRSRNWLFRARYRRGADGDNERFLTAAEPGWSLAFDPLEGVEASWGVPMAALNLDGVTLQRSTQNEAALFSALQGMLPAFSELRLEASQPLPVAVPLDAQQRPIDRPTEVPAYQRRRLRVQAPLRSLSLLLPEAAHISWERILVQVVDVDHPSLRSSRLRATLSGVLYEIQDPRDVHVVPADIPGNVAASGIAAGDGAGSAHGA